VIIGAGRGAGETIGSGRGVTIRSCRRTRPSWP